MVILLIYLRNPASDITNGVDPFVKKGSFDGIHFTTPKVCETCNALLVCVSLIIHKIGPLPLRMDVVVVGHIITISFECSDDQVNC